MGKLWACTAEQMAYLTSHFPDFLEAHQNNKIDAFRCQLYDGWASLWPEHQVLFPSWKEGDTPLTKDQMAALGKAIAM